MNVKLSPLQSRERHVIEEGTEVLGGVLQTRVGVVVDFDENPDIYYGVLSDIDDRLAKRSDVSTSVILKTVEAVVGKKINHYPRGYQHILSNEAESQSIRRLEPTHEMGLSKFVHLEVGICHQHTLLSATMLRLLQERGDIGGTVSVESPRGNKWYADRHTNVAFSEGGENFTVNVAGGVTSDVRTLAFIW